MLSIPVFSVLDRAAFHLNDVNRTYWTNAILLEPFKNAYDDFKEELIDADIRIMGEVSAALIVTTAMMDIGGPTGPALPSNFVVPITLWERLSGTSNSYDMMAPFKTLPKTEVLTSSLMYWSFRKQFIQFIGATTNRDVKIDYIGDTLSVAEDENDRINAFNAKSFLAYRTAALASEFQGEDEERAAKLNSNAQNALDKLLNTDIKNQQNMPVRRRPFRAAYRSLGTFSRR